MITKTTVKPSRVGNKTGYAFAVYYGNEYPGIISALYKTKIGAQRKLNAYLKTGKFSFYGNAER